MFDSYLKNIICFLHDHSEIEKLKTDKGAYFVNFCTNNFNLIVKFPLKILLKKFYDHFGKHFNVLDIRELDGMGRVIYFSILFNLKFIKGQPINGYL